MSAETERREKEKERECKKKTLRNKWRADGENKVLRLREMRREGIRQERERSKTNSEAAETRRATLSERKGNPVVEK